MTTTSGAEGFTLLVDVTIYADKVEEFLALYGRMLKEITKEEKFLSIEVFRSEEKPTHFYWVENWSTNLPWFNEVSLGVKIRKNIIS